MAGTAGEKALTNCATIKGKRGRWWWWCTCGSQRSNVSFANQTQLENTQIYTYLTEQNEVLERSGQLEKDRKTETTEQIVKRRKNFYQRRMEAYAGVQELESVLKCQVSSSSSQRAGNEGDLSLKRAVRHFRASVVCLRMIS